MNWIDGYRFAPPILLRTDFTSRMESGRQPNSGPSIRSAVEAIHPIQRLLLGPAGNGNALGGSNGLRRAQADGVRFGVTHPCGVGRSAEGDQKAQGQYGAHFTTPG